MWESSWLNPQELICNTSIRLDVKLMLTWHNFSVSTGHTYWRHTRKELERQTKGAILVSTALITSINWSWTFKHMHRQAKWTWSIKDTWRMSSLFFLYITCLLESEREQSHSKSDSWIALNPQIWQVVGQSCQALMEIHVETPVRYL